MKERFEKDGRPQLVDALKRQEFVGGESEARRSFDQARRTR